MADVAAATTFEDILTRAENPAFVRVVTARVLIEQNMLVEHAELDRQLSKAITDDAKENRVPQAPAIAQQIVDFEADMEAAQVEFRFRSIGKRAWANLLADNPPTKDQIARDRRLDHNPETFPIAAMTVSCASPEGATVEQFARLERSMDASQWDAMWGACITANVGGGERPKSAAAGAILRVSAQFENTHVPAASLDQSSSAA